MAAEIKRRRVVGERVQLDVQHGLGKYAVWVVPAKDASNQIVGYRVWIGNATLLLGTEEQAVEAALSAIGRIRSARDAEASEPLVEFAVGQPG